MTVISFHGLDSLPIIEQLLKQHQTSLVIQAIGDHELTLWFAERVPRVIVIDKPTGPKNVFTLSLDLLPALDEKILFYGQETRSIPNSVTVLADPTIKTFFINLAKRTDRRAQIEAELDRIGIEATRFEAIATTPGSIGCALSHASCLEAALASGDDYALIIEDDFQFCQPAKLVHDQIKQILQKHPDLFVVALGYNDYHSAEHDDLVRVAINVQTTSAYIASRAAMPALIKTFRESAEQLAAGGQLERWAIDMNWKQYQGVDKRFYLSNPRLGIQRESYSDIRERHVNYQC